MTLASVERRLATHLPGYRFESVVELGQGQENVAYQVNGELIVRFRKAADAAERAALVDRETRLLSLVALISPLAVPQPIVSVPEEGWLAYRALVGTTLLALPQGEHAVHAASIGATLGELLRALHAVPLERVAGLVEIDNDPLPEWRADAADLYGGITQVVPVAHRRAIEAFFEAPLPSIQSDDAPVFSHNDLGIEHVVIDPQTWIISGIIDWSDAAICDAAYDFGLLYRDLGPIALDAALRAYRPAETDTARLRQRAVFYGRCSVFEDLAYGRETGQRRYLDHGLAALAWLFPV
jgi:aminoglycoside phosphotransferase (APT) family kinase protein